TELGSLEGSPSPTEAASAPAMSASAEQQPEPAAAAPELPSATGLAPPGVDFGAAVDSNGAPEVCVAVAGESELRRVYLAFALDVSASMGNDAERFRLKWQPVVESAEAFFSEQDSGGLSASLTFFPAESSATWCSAAAYAVPTVPQTLLPSPAFAQAITGLGLTANGSWRTATPTLAVFSGTAASLAAI